MRLLTPVVLIFWVSQNVFATGEIVASADIGNGNRLVVTLDKDTNLKGGNHIDVVGSDGQPRTRWGSFSVCMEPSNFPIHVGSTSFASFHDRIAALVLEMSDWLGLLGEDLAAAPYSYRTIGLSGLQEPVRENER